jgi:alkaline phosphatase
MKLKFGAALLFTTMVSSTLGQTSFPIKRAENRETWKRDGWAAIDKAKGEKIRKGKAKNVILFIGDGMGVSTLTAARIFEGQRRGESGEENRLSFEQFPYSALSKTYSANQQTSDSAPTAAAIVTGVKTDEGVLSIDQNVIRGNYKSVAGNETMTILEMAEASGRSTGIVSTARLTHATPGSTYSHSPDRDWESDSDILRRSKDAYDAGFPDIARQMIETKYGNGLEVALGGGRSKYMPKETRDPEYTDQFGERSDKRDLVAEWLKKNGDSAYVWNKQQFDAIDPKKTKHLLGLFQRSHMQYEFDRKNDKAGEPSLAEMTSKAIDILAQNRKGYFLMVEGGRIDHAHHDGNAYRALSDTVALSDAVRAALSKVNLDETLIIVTADHSHVFTIAGYPARGNNIVGLVREVDDAGNVEQNPSLDRDKKPRTTLSYANGLGYVPGDRPVLTDAQVTDPNYRQEATVPLIAETHGGEDVAIFATGVNAHLIRGSMEQNWIFYVMADALRLPR